MIYEDNKLGVTPLTYTISRHKIQRLFDYIKDHFDFALIISHNDDIKKFCDISYDIDKIGVHSKICIDNMKKVNKLSESSDEKSDLEDDKPKKIVKKKGKVLDKK